MENVRSRDCVALSIKQELCRQRAFSLVELMVVVAIIGLLSTLAVVAAGAASVVCACTKVGRLIARTSAVVESRVFIQNSSEGEWRIDSRPLARPTD